MGFQVADLQTAALPVPRQTEKMDHRLNQNHLGPHHRADLRQIQPCLLPHHRRFLESMKVVR